MSKRPLCQAAVWMALGIALFWQTYWNICLAAALAVLSAFLEIKFFAVYDALPKSSLKKFWRGYVCQVLFILLFIGVGMWRAGECEKAGLSIENKTEAAISGKIYDQQVKEDKTVFYLKEVVFLNNQKYSSDDIPSQFQGKCIAYYQGEETYSIGNTIRLNGKISLFEEGRNPGQFDAKAYYKGMDIDFSIFQIEIIGNDKKEDWLKNHLFRIKKAIYKKLEVLAGKHASILAAMLLGEKSQMDQEVKELYQKSGISHVLVISGLHFSLIGMCLYEMLRRFGASFKAAGAVSLVLLFLYGVMTGFGVSAVRAFIMFAVSIGAAVLGRGYDLPSALGASVLYLLLRNPNVLFQTGFMLSVGAILGIIIVLPVLDFFFPPKERKYTVLSTLCQGIRSGIGIQIATFPILLYAFYEFSPYSIILNCLIIPLLSVVILCAIAAVFLGFFIPQIAGIVMFLSTVILDLYEVLCRLVSKLPGAYVVTGKPTWHGIILYYLMAGSLAAACLYIRNRKAEAPDKKEESDGIWESSYLKKQVCKCVGAAAFLLAGYLLLVWQNHSGMRVSMLDVGQGQSIYIQSDGADILYDGGSTDVSQVGKYRIAPFLKASGVDRLELVIVSHLDADHYNGVQQLLEEDLIAVDCLMLPKLEEEDESYIKLTQLAREKGIKVQTVGTNDHFKIEKAQFHVLHPSSGFHAANKNETSIVMAMQYGDFTMLFTGDVEQEGEESMLENGVLTDVDVLQAAHHGSASSSTEAFLEAVSPETVLISCGKNNRYGHPSSDTIRRLEALGCKLHITMEEGCITFKIQKKS